VRQFKRRHFEEQRERRKPVWTTTVAGTAFGIDSQYIHVAGIKIPTAALALLPIRLPEGNYDEQMRARHLQEMREDLMQAAARAETYHDFKRYVQELRARKQAERDAEKRARGDTTTTKADTVITSPKARLNMLDTPNCRVNPTAHSARIDDVTSPKPIASVNWLIRRARLSRPVASRR